MCVCFHACTHPCGDVTAWLRIHLWTCESEHVWPERSADSMTVSIECIASVHLKQEVAVSFRLGDKVTRRHLHSQGGYLFHRVMVSQSAHQPCIFIDFWLPCQPPHTRSDPQHAIIAVSPLKHDPSCRCNHPVPS